LRTPLGTYDLANWALKWLGISGALQNMYFKSKYTRYFEICCPCLGSAPVRYMGWAWDGNTRWRLDLLLVAECPDLSENTGLSEDTGSRAQGYGHGVGFELKVDLISKTEISKAIGQAIKYAKLFKIDVYLPRELPIPLPEAGTIQVGDLRIFLVNVIYDNDLNDFEVRSCVEESDGEIIQKDFRVSPVGDSDFPN
jgi:hypothetical protein